MISSPRPVAPVLVATALAATGLAACGTGAIELREPRRLVTYTGARLDPQRERMEEIDNWVREQWDSITVDPSFMIYSEASEGPVYPWETLEINEAGDTATIRVQGRSGGSQLYTIYAHYHLMAAQNRLDKWLPEVSDGPDAEAFELERAILSRVADVWLYQRSILDAAPYGLFDELVYAKEQDFLDEFILTARPADFVEARRARLSANPGRDEVYREWFRRTFEREPPGLRGDTNRGGTSQGGTAGG